MTVDHSHYVLSMATYMLQCRSRITVFEPEWTVKSNIYTEKIESLFVTSWTVAHQATLSMEFSRQEYWHGLPFPSPGKITWEVNKTLMPGCPLLGT